jgi:TRAP-type uncharacterized transport system substrate-binding protein
MSNLFDPNNPPTTSRTWQDVLLTFLIVFFLAFGIVAFGTYIKANAAELGAPVVKICTGGKDNPYDRAAKYIGQFSKQLSIQSLNTEGSGEALEKALSGECDAYIGQPDATAFLARSNRAKAQTVTKVGVLFREYAHVLCSVASGVDDLSDLSGSDKYSIDLGKTGSGAWLMWQNFVAEDDSYAKVKPKSSGGIKSLTEVANNQTTCALFVGGIHSKIVDTANDSFEGQVALVGAGDRDFNDAKDIDGSPLYEFVDMPNAYDHLQGFWDITTISTKATIYVSGTSKVLADEENYNNFLLAVTRARPGILAEFGN